MMKLKYVQLSLLFVTIIVAVFSASAVLFDYKFPVGWDIFYHLRVFELTKAQGKFLPFDPNSAGGRIHTYPPAFYALLLSISEMTGLAGADVMRLLAPLLFAMMCFAVFAVTRKLFGTVPALAALLFLTSSPGIMERFVITTMPEAVGHFLIPVCLLCFLFFESLAPVLLFTLGSVHFISTVVFFVFILVLMTCRRKVSDFMHAGFLFLFPAVWKLYLPNYNLPVWGIKNTLERIVGKVGAFHALSVPFLFSFNPYFFISVLILLLSKFSPLLPIRLPYYAVFPLSLAFADRCKSFVEIHGDDAFQTLMLVLFSVAFFSEPLLFSQTPYPEFRPQDFEASGWISQNTALNSTVSGFADLTSVWVLYYARRPTIIDGYSEGVPDAGRRLSDQLEAYYGNITAAREFLSEYGVKYIFTNRLERRMAPQLDFDKFYSLPCVFNATTAFVFVFE